MFVKTLVTAEGNIDNPTWEQIEGSIRRLTRPEHSVRLLPAGEAGVFLTILNFMKPEEAGPDTYFLAFSNGAGGPGATLETALNVAKAFAERGEILPAARSSETRPVR